jgi:hypothetical protein
VSVGFASYCQVAQLVENTDIFQNNCRIRKYFDIKNEHSPSVFNKVASSPESVHRLLVLGTIGYREAGPFHILITTWPMNLSNHLPYRSHILFVDKISCNIYPILSLSREDIPIYPFFAVGTSIPPLQ